MYGVGRSTLRCVGCGVGKSTLRGVDCVVKVGVGSNVLRSVWYVEVDLVCVICVCGVVKYSGLHVGVGRRAGLRAAI